MAYETDLAYVLGVVKGDGSVYESEKRYIIELDTVTPKFNFVFHEALKRLGLNPSTWKRKKIHGGWGKKLKWRTKAHSKKLYMLLKGLTLDKLKDFLDADEKKIAFLKGFYESDGNLDHPAHEHLRIRLYNTKLKLCKLTFSLLVQLGFHPTIRESKPEYWVVALNRKRESYAFLRSVCPCIKGGGHIEL